MDYTRVDIPVEDDLCPSCQEENMQIEYFWVNGEKGEETGDCICTCGHREKK